MINAPFARSLRDDFVACFDLKDLFCCKTWIRETRGRYYMIFADLLERRAMVVHGFDHDQGRVRNLERLTLITCHDIRLFIIWSMYHRNDHTSIHNSQLGKRDRSQTISRASFPLETSSRDDASRPAHIRGFPRSMCRVGPAFSPCRSPHLPRTP